MQANGRQKTAQPEQVDLHPPALRDSLVTVTSEELSTFRKSRGFADRIDRAIGRAQKEGRAKLNLDFRQVNRVGSEGLNELIAINSHARCDGVQVVLVNVQENVREVFSMTRLERLFEFA
ncbi:MAG: STAS domain-containing protein [Planctomycetota bacterium]